MVNKFPVLVCSAFLPLPITISAEGGTCLNPLSEPKEKKFKAIRATGKDSVSSNNTDQHGGSTQKLLKQTAESISDCAKSSHKESAHIVFKKELGVGGGEQMPKEKTLEYTNMKEHVVVIQELDDTSNTTGRSLSPRVRDKLNLLIKSDLHEQKNGMLNGAAEKLACSSIHKFYMRRSSNHTALKKG
ncbi:hypothetical protein GUJ93_ZPchr0015g6625 [Zizania palustris]|uniref:Uncharacterized protein n=1 Tax=Zizania palustris TaxID=103762 RepID=A0A8J5VVK7_ZIZPA|nr:hypothetical protein GUJ93_ZPchr0015g6625 [Zizania palustris]